MVETLTVLESLKCSPMVTRAVAVMEVSMVASKRPNARLEESLDFVLGLRLT